MLITLRQLCCQSRSLKGIHSISQAFAMVCVRESGVALLQLSPCCRASLSFPARSKVPRCRSLVVISDSRMRSTMEGIIDEFRGGKVSYSL